MSVGLLVGVAGGLVLVCYVLLYNALVKAQEKVQEAWSGIDVQLKRRYDLIDTLVSVVKSYVKHEKELLETITDARSKAMKQTSNGPTPQQAQQESVLSHAVVGLFGVVENYPDLKADQQYLHLQYELTDTEDRLSAARRIYNANVRLLNTKTKTFPSVLVAGIHSIQAQEFFEMDETTAAAARQKPQLAL